MTCSRSEIIFLVSIWTLLSVHVLTLGTHHTLPCLPHQILSQAGRKTEARLRQPGQKLTEEFGQMNQRKCVSSLGGLDTFRGEERDCRPSLPSEHKRLLYCNLTT